MITKTKPNNWSREFPAGDYNDRHEIIADAEGLEIDYDKLPWTELLGDLTDDERLAIFHEFCICCGAKTLPCYCMRDD